MKSFIFWDTMMCSLLKGNRHFGGTYCLHLQGHNVSQAKNHHEAGSSKESKLMRKSTVSYRIGGNFDTEDEDNIFLQNNC
jgi:hypothetical protein